MSPEAQRVAIAEACGWTDVSERYESNGWDFTGLHPLHTPHSNRHFVPDYLADLNAMAEAEKTLTNDQYAAYWKRLVAMCELNTDEWTFCKEWSATAAQRAEAFLRTLGLWDDTK